MPSRFASDLVLAADIWASGRFAAVGTMHAPCPALAAALQDVRDNHGDPELLRIQVHALAWNVSGLCVLDNAGIGKVLQACFAAQLVAGWRIEVPGVGLLHALCALVRFEHVRDTGRIAALELRLAGKPEFIALYRRMA